VEGSFEHGNEPSGSIKFLEVADGLSRLSQLHERSLVILIIQVAQRNGKI
jgi:hypothetical protein